MDSTLAAAEDASIIREALSRLSETQRTALVMWEVEGRSTTEIAKAIGTSEKNVRHVVQRARASFVRVLSEWIVDEKSGATALDALSTTYKKAAELAQKSSKVALSLLIVMVAFLGFNSVTGSEFNTPNVISNFTQEAPANSDDKEARILPTPSTDEAVASSNKSVIDNSMINARALTSIFAGLSDDGIPTGFSVSDLTGQVGPLLVTSPSTILNPDGYDLVSYAQSQGDESINILLSQTITVDGAGTSYIASPSISIAGNWYPLTLNQTLFKSQRLVNGNYLLVATLSVNSTVETEVFIDTQAGKDVDMIPNEITTRIIMDSGKSQILAQAINISASGVK